MVVVNEVGAQSGQLASGNLDQETVCTWQGKQEAVPSQIYGVGKMIRDALNFIGENYLAQAQQNFSGNQLGEYVRKVAPAELNEAVESEGFLFKGSIGQSNWADVPWLGIFNPEITDSAQRGYYIVYLFRADLTAVHLCLGQGVTVVREEFGRERHDELGRRAEIIRFRIPEFAKTFSVGPFPLEGHTPLANDYEAAPAFGKTYALNALPTENELQFDLQEMLRLYLLLTARGGFETATDQFDSGQSDKANTVEEQKRYRRHRRIERNTKAAAQAKRFLGVTCQVCNFNYKKTYGELGESYIEAHHLIPLASLPEGQVVSMDLQKDFAVLCANCHRMVHQSNPPLSPHELRERMQSLANDQPANRRSPGAGC